MSGSRYKRDWKGEEGINSQRKGSGGTRRPKSPPASAQGGIGAAARRREIRKIAESGKHESPIPLEIDLEPQAGAGVIMLEEENRKELGIGYKPRKIYSGMWQRRFALNSTGQREFIRRMNLENRHLIL